MRGMATASEGQSSRSAHATNEPLDIDYLPSDPTGSLVLQSPNLSL